MKNTLILLLATAAVAAGGCSKHETSPENDGYGTLHIAVASDAKISTRSEIEASAQVPSGDEFALTMTGTDYEQSWSTLAEFNA